MKAVNFLKHLQPCEGILEVRVCELGKAAYSICVCSREPLDGLLKLAAFCKMNDFTVMSFTIENGVLTVYVV